MNDTELVQKLINCMGMIVSTNLSLASDFARKANTVSEDQRQTCWNLESDFKHKALGICTLAVECGIADRLQFSDKTEKEARAMISRFQRALDKLKREGYYYEG